MINYKIIAMQNTNTSYFWDIINLYILYSIRNINDNYIGHIVYDILGMYLCTIYNSMYAGESNLCIL